METPKGKCLTIDSNSNVVIMEDLSMYELVLSGEEDGTVLASKLPAKATIDFSAVWSGASSIKANWTNPHLPVDWNGHDLVWDY